MKITFCPESDCTGIDCIRIRECIERSSREGWTRNMALTEALPSGLSQDRVALAFEQSFSVGMVSDAHGVNHMTPMDAEYEIHEGGPSPEDPDSITYYAIYSGQIPADRLIEAEPEWTQELMDGRVKALWDRTHA